MVTESSRRIYCIKNAGLTWSKYQQKYGIKRGKTQWMTLEELTREYRGIVERIPNYIIEAAKGRIRVNGIKGSIAKRILLRNGKPADTIMKKWGWRTGTPLGRSEMGITRPNIRDRRSIQKQEKNNTEHDKQEERILESGAYQTIDSLGPPRNFTCLN